MRTSRLLVAFLVLLTLGCGGRLGGARDKACTGACNEAQERCDAQCSKGRTPDVLCEKGCDKAEKECVDRCDGS